MKAWSISILLLFAASLHVDACRFTVREIGFSVLSQNIYTVAVIDEGANAEDVFWQEYHEKNRDCNLRLEVLNPCFDVEHPIVKKAKQKGVQFPAIVLTAPDGRLYLFKERAISEVYQEILESTLGLSLSHLFPEVFAVIVWLEGEDAEKNQTAENKLKQACKDIESIMPNMPKMVKKGPVSISVSREDFQRERLLFWSLGIHSIPPEPLAFVIYGRGRIIGEVLNYQQILDGELYSYMSMIGADCECGLDKKWMLGHQIPLFWGQKSRTYLTKLLGFDVDNPLILAEMSRILAKESLSDQSGSIAFAPESIDLEEVFGNSETVSETKTEEPAESRSGKVLIYTFIFLIAIVLITGLLILRMK